MIRPDNKAHLRSPIEKGDSVTESERFLKSLCESSFLSLWSYPAPYRQPGKELCDLLVVCGDDVIIFSDKHCEIGKEENAELAWKRWYKRAITKSASQAWGAERWLKSHPDRVFLDPKCENAFPIDIPPPDRARFHLIVVANGCRSRCIEEMGGTGSFILFTTGEMPTPHIGPFTIGDINPQKTFVHVFNETTLDVVVSGLDTVTDLVYYLQKKVALLRSEVAISATGEEELLAHYLAKLNDANEHDFVFDDRATMVVFDEGSWEEFHKRPERQAQLQADEISYLWDSLIERFSRHILEGTQYYASHEDLGSTEKGLRIMALEPRFHRRLYSEKLIRVFTPRNDGNKNAAVIAPQEPGHPFYVALSHPRDPGKDFESYREFRGSLLEAYCLVVKHLFPSALDIIGIASEPFDQEGGSSEDLAYLDAREWTDEQANDAARYHEEAGLFKNVRQEQMHGDEYPDVQPRPTSRMQRRVGRNEPCPCGSGMKHKKCCLS